MPSSPSSSTLGTITAQRAKLSQIRQRLGLELMPGKMRELAPSPVNGPADVRGHAQKAMQEEPDFDFDNYQIPPDKETAMLDQIQGWIDRNNNGIDDRMEGKNNANTQRVDDPRVKAALGPMAEFFKAHGRLPTPQELKQTAARNAVKQHLQRDPTDEEVAMYMAQPPKELAMKEEKK